MATKSMRFITFLKKTVLLGHTSRRTSSSKENQQMHSVSTTKKGSSKGMRAGGPGTGLEPFSRLGSCKKEGLQGGPRQAWDTRGRPGSWLKYPTTALPVGQLLLSPRPPGTQVSQTLPQDPRDG